MPPPGFTPGTGFTGFIDTDGASIVVVEFPAASFKTLPKASDFRRGDAAGTGKRLLADGEQWTLPDGTSGTYAVIANETVDPAVETHSLMLLVGDTLVFVNANIPKGARVSPAAMVAALRSVRIGTAMTPDAQMAALDFAVGDRAGLRPVTIIAGSAVVLTEGPSDSGFATSQPGVVIGLEPEADAGRPEASALAFFRRTFPGATITSQRYDPAVRRHVIEGSGEEKGTALRYVQVLTFDPRSPVRTICIWRPQLDFAARCQRIAQSVALRPRSKE